VVLVVVVLVVVVVVIVVVVELVVTVVISQRPIRAQGVYTCHKTERINGTMELRDVGVDTF